MTQLDRNGFRHIVMCLLASLALSNTVFAEDLVIPGSGNSEFVLAQLAKTFNSQQALHRVSVPPSTGTAGALRTKKLDAPAGDDRFWMRITLRDTRVCIAAAELGNLFKPFTQADASANRRFGGSGLELVICKHLVEFMGGAIHVESSPGCGSSFWRDLPFGVADSSVPALRGKKGSSTRVTGRVLVVEDNIVNQQVVQAMLARLGAKVTIVDNGALTVEALQNEQFDLVLMDCQMLVVDGYTATAQIRAAEPANQRIPIIALTANAFAEDRQQCADAGMDDYLAKPVSFATLTEALLRWLPATDEPSAVPAENAQSAPHSA